MKSFNHVQTKEEFIKRVNKLTPNSNPTWGKMNVQQMLNHLNDFFHLAAERKVVNDSSGVKLLSFFVGGIFKGRIINSEKPFPKGIGNAPLPDASDFETEKKQLINSIITYNQSDFTKKSLSVFGKMSPALWDKFIVRQFEHHLTQFGV